MGRKTLRCEELGDIGACSICENCIEKRHPWYYCAESNDDFGNVDYPEDCEDFEFKSDDDDDDDEEFDNNSCDGDWGCYCDEDDCDCHCEFDD